VTGRRFRCQVGDSRVVMPVRSGLLLPLFGELADPAMIARLSPEAEQAGWHGVFVRDHARWQLELAVADPWITLATVATATERVRLKPMVTPLARQRPVKPARETATLDRLSGGRLPAQPAVLAQLPLADIEHQRPAPLREAP
jgi:hypothetical protein